jgi:hypothetical protein
VVYEAIRDFPVEDESAALHTASATLKPDRVYYPAPLYATNVDRAYPTTETIIFESKFESGNLRKVVKVEEDEYKLWLEPDFGTLGHTMWFYFSATSFKAGQKIRFYIQNLHRPESMYKSGMKPVVECRDGTMEQEVEEVLYY